MFLFGKEYEPCKGCEILKQQLEASRLMIQYETDRNTELTHSIMELIKPKVPEVSQAELHPIRTAAAPFSKRREHLEQMERERARVIKQSPHLGRPDASVDKVEQLESELGIEEEKTS